MLRMARLDAKKKASRPPPSPPAPEALSAARSAGLRYVNDDDAGLTRHCAKRGFHFTHPNRRRVTDAATLARIKRLAIPPAWTRVWICPRENGHIQATGRDARGRKQYRYHSAWRAVRDDSKYERMIAFGQALPRIRRRVARDINRPGLGREKVVATMVRLLETTLVRVGNEQYARDNGSFGLSTMEDKHAKVQRGAVCFTFKGKSGRHHRIAAYEPRLARIVRQVQDLPGQQLFQYLDDEGRRQDVKSQDVNDYLRSISGQEFSAKDFRTWAGTVLAAVMLRQVERFATRTEAKKNLIGAIERVAERLGNTPAVCRQCYIHPVVLESYLDGATVELLRTKVEEALRTDLAKLSGAEGAVLAFLQQRLRQGAPAPMLSSLRRSVAQQRRARGARPRDGTSGGARAAARSRRRTPPA